MPLPFRGLRTSSRACSLFGSQRAGWIDPGGFAGCHPASGNSDGSEHSDRDPKGGRIPRLDLEQDTAQQTIERHGCAESGSASYAGYLRGIPYNGHQNARVAARRAAIRMPNSFVRRRTEYAVAVKTPNAASWISHRI